MKSTHSLHEGQGERVVQTPFAEEIREICGENVYLCYQCQKCASGCPVAEYFDLSPNQLMRAIQLDERELARKALSWTLSQGVHVTIPPGEESLWRLGVELGPVCKAPTEQEVLELRVAAAGCKALFS